MQETVAYLGELDARSRARARGLALRMTGRGEQYELFERRGEKSETVPVRLDRVRLERSRQFGDVWLGWTLWRALGLERFCGERLAAGRERVPWETMAAILVLARLCEPSSELHIAEDWYRRHGAERSAGVPAELVNDDRLYRALDRLLPHKRRWRRISRRRLGELFALDYELLLYDVTSTYFEGQAEGQSAGAARPQPRPPAGLQAGLHRPGGDARGHAAGLRGVRRQPHRRDHGRGDRRDDGGAATAGRAASG